MQSQNLNRLKKDYNWGCLKRFGELIQTSENKKEFRQKLNGFLVGIESNCALTPTNLKKIKIFKEFKTKF